MWQFANVFFYLLYKFKKMLSIPPSIVPLAIGGAYLMENHCDAYASALQLLLFSCATEVLTSFGLGDIIWLFMFPVVMLSATGPLFTQYAKFMFV